MDKVVSRHMLDNFKTVMQYSDMTCHRYIPLLNIVASLANGCEDAADDFLQEDENFMIHKVLF